MSSFIQIIINTIYKSLKNSLKWLEQSKLLENLLELKPPVSTSPLRLLERVPPPLEELRSPTDSDLEQSLSVKSENTKSPPNF